jgi:poly [ADP-ribose] polymerase
MVNVLKEELLNFASLEGNNNKFYKIQLVEIDSTHFDVYAEYGRVGAVNPQKDRKTFVHVDLAEKQYEKKLKEKIKKGYHPIITADKDDSVNGNVDVKKNNPVVKDEVLKLIGRLFDYSKSYVKKSITTPLGNLSKPQVEKGRKVLKEIEKLLDSGVSSSDVFLKLSDEFYAAIPYVFGYKVDMSIMLIDNYRKLNQRKDLLDVMESLVNANLNSEVEEQYKALNIKLKYLDKNESKFKSLVDNVSNTQGYNHHFNINVNNIYEVEYMDNPPVFNPLNVKVQELYHGSRSENIIHILQTGLRIKPSSAIHTGSMFGAGIYFADQSTKSANYCWGFGHKDRSLDYYLLVCEVAVGKMKDYTSAQSNLRSAPRGYNSVRGVKGSALMHNEIIVYKESQVRIKYILEFKSA